MPAPINIHVYSDALVLLGTAGIIIPLVHRFGLNPVLGYLGAGAILGPLGLGSFIGSFPFLYWFTVIDARNVSGFADLGIVFLLFLIGMELSYERLKAMRRLIFGLGGSQIVLSAAVIGGIAALAGSKPPVALILGACLALSSTAIVVELLSRQGRLNTSAGRASFATLLAQDLAVAPLLLFISIFGTGEAGSVVATLLLALTNAAIALGVIVIVGRVVMRPLFRLVASAGMSELFVATTLFVIVATGVAAAVAGFSMALGAFVAGLLLAETEFRKAIETAIDPFKGLLLGLFFFTVGMNIDFRELARDPVWLIGGAVGLIAVKSGILVVLARLFRLSWPASLEVATAARPRRRIRLRRNRVGDNARPDRCQRVELHGSADIADHDAHARAFASRAVAGPDGARRQAGRSRACRRAARWQRSCHRRRARPGRTSGLLDARSAQVRISCRR